MGYIQMRTSKQLNMIRWIIITVFTLVLSLILYNNFQKQHHMIIETYLELEYKIIQETANISNLWFKEKIEQGVPIEQIEQEILINFVAPLRLLENGDAWIYNRDYVIFDKSSDFPEEYRGKSMRQIFDIQRSYGAIHYNELVEGVENATEGRGWYIWLPEKGREWVAWTSFRFHDQTWTLGFSTPEKEIVEYSRFRTFMARQILYVLLLILFLYFVSSVVISFQRRQEKLIKEINETNTALKGIDTMKNEFIMNISHDFRSPLSIIFSLAELNLSGKTGLTKKIEEDFRIIYHTALKFLSKINTLIDLTKIETKGINLTIAKINLSDFLTASIKYYSSILKHSNITVELDVESEASGICYTDPEKLDDIVNNLMSNAIKFVNKENGRINVYLKETEETAVIRVKDNGLGLKKEDLEIIFKRFEQSDNASTIQYKGSGVGLAYCRQLIDLLGGSINADSEGQNRGAVFTVTLDKKKFGEADVNSEDKYSHYIPRCVNLDFDHMNRNETLVSIEETNRQNEFSHYKGIILIVEDDGAIRDIIIRTLKSAGYRNFIAVCNGEEAEKMMYSYHPDLVITDYQMPKMNGAEFYERVNKYSDFELIPFIFISAIADETVILEQKASGAVDFLLKPVKRNELLVSVNTNMKKYMEFTKVSAIDELTKVYNRRMLFKLFEGIVLRPQVSDLSLIMLDLDHFKTVNDEYGHPAGDYVLSKVGLAILEMIRAQDLVGRYGGEEFMVLLPETDIGSAKIAAEKIRAGIENLNMVYQGEAVKITISAGISSLKLCEKSGKTPDEKMNCIKDMIALADSALYRAKFSACTACGYTGIEGGETNGGKCPECGAAFASGRNRVEVCDNSASTQSI